MPTTFRSPTEAADAGFGLLDPIKELVAKLFRIGRDEKETPADRFASWLPYQSYRREDRLFINNDGVGFLLEVLPQSGAEERMVEVLVSLYANCPPGTGVQFHLFASPHISDTLVRYCSLRMEDEDNAQKSEVYGRPARNDNLFRKLARMRYAHFTEATRTSLTRGSHFTIRDFRLMMSVTVPADAEDVPRRELILQLRDGMSQTLDSASFPNRVCSAKDLINWVSLFVNPDRMTRAQVPTLEYDDGREIPPQMVDHDTIQDASAGGLRLWKEHDEHQLEVRYFGIKGFPERFGLWGMGALIGDLMQPALQYNTPFLLTMGVFVLDPNATKSKVTANHYRAEQNAQSKMAAVMPDAAKKAADWRVVANAIDAGGSIVSMYHSLALFSDARRAVQATEAARAIWRNRGFELNANTFLHRPSLLASLPMALSPKLHADLLKLGLVTRKTIANAVHLAPMLGEWRGTKTPTMMFAGRRGQLMTLDLYDNPGNYNAAIIGAPGSGKSVLMNEIAVSYRSVGARVWMLDLGKSFEKLCRKSGGSYIEFSPNSRICLNPFSVVSPERVAADGTVEGGIKEDIAMLTPALAKMCSMANRLEDVQLRAIEVTILRLYKLYGREMNITALRDAFLSGTVDNLGLTNDQRIKDLAILLEPYTRDGTYGRFFDGQNNVDFDNDLLCVENEELKRVPELHAVVNILLMFQITGQMYLSRDRKKLLMIDELSQQLGDIGSDDPTKAAVVEEAARRARKYGGALITATQSAEDYYKSLQMAAALACTDWMFLLRQKPESFDLLAANHRLTMDEGKKRLLQSMRTEPDVFSECYIASPVGEGLARLILDPFAGLLFSNRLEDNKPIDDYRARGLTIDEAIFAVLRDRGRA